jgi:hypothetical protein
MIESMRDDVLSQTVSCAGIVSIEMILMSAYRMMVWKLGIVCFRCHSVKQKVPSVIVGEFHLISRLFSVLPPLKYFCILTSARTECSADSPWVGHPTENERQRTMRILDQHKLVSELKAYVGKMTSGERYEFEMMQKRDKDDEELDQLAWAKLETMHKRLVVKKTKKEIEELFRKMTSNPDQEKA